ncbi:hypothetical protein A6R68_02829 [Neotoma lepida]|uniref:Uncharacterized protein n=1 Tax=Neotoma lepida TaxID=56216 RepID=A0A1A6GQP5_NEOLE|nr:hypothetical protein A6R68_02829 [Neotoma lepida]
MGMQDKTLLKAGRERKKSIAACGVEPRSDAIHPIREAIRHFGHKTGPLSPFTNQEKEQKESRKENKGMEERGAIPSLLPPRTVPRRLQTQLRQGW